MPFMPMPGEAAWGWPGQNADGEGQQGDFRSLMEAFWEQQCDMQKSSMEAAKKWWDAFFG
jgi:hypothetical protein